MSLEYLLTWLLVLMRSLGIIILLPTLAGRSLPVTVRGALGICVATLVTGVVPAAQLPTNQADLVFAVMGEVILGLAMGFVGRLTFAAVEMAGRIITSEIGLTASPGFGVPEPAHEPLAAMLSIFAGVLFFQVGGHLMAITAFTRSFRLAAPGHAIFHTGTPEFLIQSTGHLLELGLRMAAPFIALNFLVTLAFAVLSRAVPKMNVFILSYSVRLLAGIALFSGAGVLIARYLFVEFAALPFNLLRLLPSP